MILQYMYTVSFVQIKGLTFSFYYCFFTLGACELLASDSSWNKQQVIMNCRHPTVLWNTKDTPSVLLCFSPAPFSTFPNLLSSLFRIQMDSFEHPHTRPDPTAFAFCIWLTSFNIMTSSSIQFASNDRISFFLKFSLASYVAPSL